MSAQTEVRNNLNDLPLTAETYKKLCEVCQFGQVPIDQKVVVERLEPGYYKKRFLVVSNPIWLDPKHIAFWATDGWRLPFGYGVHRGVIEVYID